MRSQLYRLPSLEAGEGLGAQTARLFSAIWLLAALCFVVGTALMRGHLLDDTFIHLRYAENLSHTGELAYNAGEPSFGTSALTYVLLFAKLASAFPRELLPLIAKWSSVAFHAATLGLLAWRARGMLREGATAAAWSLTAFGFALALPPSGRWLQDGMETSLAVLLTVVAALVAHGSRASSNRRWLGLLAGLACAAPFCLRIDLLPISVASLGLAFWNWRSRPRLLLASTWLLAIALGLVLLVLQTGHVVSDSATAKQTGVFQPWFALEFLRSTLAVSPVWLLGLAWLLWRLPKAPVVAALGLLPILATLAAGSLAGQVIHGARYFLPALLFAWVAYAEHRASFRDEAQRRFEQIGVAAAVLVSILHAAVLAKPLSRVIQPVELDVRALPTFDGEALIAAHDVGRLGWLTKARVLDLAGLVNGRKLANPALHEDRLCAAARDLGIPSALVLTESQASFRKSGDVIELRCGDIEARYRQSREPMMKAWNLTMPLAWFVWERVENERTVKGEGALR